VLRIALIYALLDHQHQIGLAHLNAALEIVRYSNDSVRRIFGDLTGNKIADTILAALRRNRRSRHTARGGGREVSFDDLVGTREDRWRDRKA